MTEAEIVICALTFAYIIPALSIWIAKETWRESNDAVLLCLLSILPIGNVVVAAQLYEKDGFVFKIVRRK